MSRSPRHPVRSLFAGSGRRGVLVLLVVAVGVVLAAPATAGASVSEAHAKAYKKKLAVYDKWMQNEQAHFNNNSQTANMWVRVIQDALSLGQPDLLAMDEQSCLEVRGRMLDEVQDRRKDSDKDMDKFAAQALTWFPPKTAKADKKSFAAAFKLVRAGLTELYTAERGLGSALLALGISADISTANDKIFTAGSQAITAQAEFDRGLTGLRKLQ